MSYRGAVQLLCATLLVAIAVSNATARPAESSGRTIAFGDVHGAYEELISVLRAAGAVDADLAWSAGDAVVVSVGDLVDRGAASRQVLDLLMRLEREAAAAGGQMHVIVGNHEVMNLMGDLRYVAPGEFAAFAADESPELRREMLESFAALPENAGLDEATVATQFAERFPPGWFAHRQAFSPDGVYGRWLLTRPALLIVGDTVFAHAGLPAYLAELDVDRFNAEYQRELNGWFEALAALERGGILTVFDDGNEALRKAKAWLESGESGGSPLRTAAESLLATEDSRALGLDSPFWYRGTALCHAALERPTTESVLRHLGAERVVMGHTPTPRGVVHQRFDGQALRIDTGMNREVYGGHPAVLLIEPAGLSARYAEPGIEAGIEKLPTYAGGERLGIAESRILDALSAAEVSGSEPAGPDALAVTVTLDGVSVPAVFRRLDEDAVARELAAYRLDRLLDIGLVPPTVAREIEGRKGVLQLRPGRIVSHAALQAAGQGIQQSWCPVTPQYQLLYAFDTLLLNERRTPDSILYDTDRWMVMSTAHDASFGTARRLPRQLANTPLEPLPGLIDRLDSLTEAELQDALGSLLSKREIKAIIERARLLPRGAAAAAAAAH